MARATTPPDPLTDQDLAELRRIIAAAPWKRATSAAYADAPHSYIIAHRSGPEWRFFADRIRRCGVMRSWRGHRYRYLLIDGQCYWVDFPALNRADESTLDPLPT